MPSVDQSGSFVWVLSHDIEGNSSAQVYATLSYQGDAAAWAQLIAWKAINGCPDTVGPKVALTGAGTITLGPVATTCNGRYVGINVKIGVESSVPEAKATIIKLESVRLSWT